MDWAKVHALAVEFLKDRGLDDLSVDAIIPNITNVTQEELDFVAPVDGCNSVCDWVSNSILLGPKANKSSPLHEWFHLAVKNKDGHYFCGQVAEEFAQWAVKRI